jgi:hypothetical protein
VKSKQTKASLEQPLEPLINKKKVPLVAPTAEQPKRKKEKVHRGGTPMFFQPQPMAKSKKLIPVNYKGPLPTCLLFAGAFNDSRMEFADILSSENFLYDDVEGIFFVTPPPPDL